MQTAMGRPLAAVLALTLMLAACGGSDGKGGGGATATSLGAPGRPGAATTQSAVRAGEALRRGQDAIDTARGYHVEVAGHNIVLPRWGAIDSASLDVATDGPAASGTVERTGDGLYNIIFSGGGDVFPPPDL